MASPLNLYRADDARAIDRAALGRLGIPGTDLMARAGAAAWSFLRARWPPARRIGIACGPGNNGGDGYVLARLARAGGCDVALVVPDGAPRSAEARAAAAAWEGAGGAVWSFEGVLPEADVWVDALFGIGLTRAPEGAAAALIAALNASGRPLLALDVPSGVDAGTGAVPGVAVHAAATLQFIVAKRGLATGPALDCLGASTVDALDLPVEFLDEFAPAAQAWRADALARWLSPRARNAHKGRYGHVLCVGGELGYGGAVRLCAEGALRSGAGLVSVATRAAHVGALLAARPEIMARAVEDSGEFAPLLERADVLALGPGLGQGEWGRALWAAVLAANKPSVLDADALNLLAAAPRALADAVLTPHPGEAARLLDASVAEIQADRFRAAEALAAQTGCAVVLKGAGTVVAAPDRTTAVIAAGNPGMAVGGMGDVLTGAIAALRAQGLSAFDAALCGALLHAAAGDAAAGEGGERGLLPSDLFTHLRRLANPNLDGPAQT